MLIDTHCHLNDPAFKETLPEVKARAKAAGVSCFIVPAYDFESLGRTAELAASSPGVIFPAFGIHPWHVQEPINYGEVLPFIRQHHPVAIGEIGLDFSPECPPQEIQTKSLIRQLEWAGEYDLPVTIHCRKAYDALYQILLDVGGKIRGAMHSFSGNKEMIFKFIELGFYISFSGSVTRKTAGSIIRTRRQCPLIACFLRRMRPRSRRKRLARIRGRTPPYR